MRADAPDYPGSPSFGAVTAHSVEVSAPGLPNGAVSLTLQKRLAWDYYADFDEFAVNLAGSATTTATGLDSNSYYAFRFLAVNADGETAGYENWTQTLPDAPGVPSAPTTTQIHSDSIQIHIPTLPANANQLLLQYKTGTGTWQDAGTFDSYAAYYGYDAYLGNLTPETVYLARWIAQGYGGNTTGPANSFTTSPAPPGTPNSPSIDQITATSARATLPALPALPAGATSLRLEKRTAWDYEMPFVMVAENLAGGAAITISGLSPNVYYSVRCVAVGPGGETASYETSFQTLPPAPSAPAAPTFVNVQFSSFESPLPAFPSYANQLKLQ